MAVDRSHRIPGSPSADAGPLPALTSPTVVWTCGIGVSLEPVTLQSDVSRYYPLQSRYIYGTLKNIVSQELYEGVSVEENILPR